MHFFVRAGRLRETIGPESRGVKMQISPNEPLDGRRVCRCHDWAQKSFYLIERDPNRIYLASS